MPHAATDEMVHFPKNMKFFKYAVGSHSLR